MIEESDLYRMLERVAEGEDLTVVMAMASADSVVGRVPDFEEMAHEVRKVWASSLIRRGAVRTAHPGLGSVLDGVEQSMKRYENTAWAQRR